MTSHPPDDPRFGDHARRIFDLEQQMTRIASQQLAHEQVCGARYKALEDKVDTGNKVTVELKTETAKQTETLTEIRVALGIQKGSKSALIWLLQWVFLPSMAAAVALIGALFSGVLAVHAG